MLTYDLSQRDDTPLYEYLYELIAADIRQGRLGANKKLPSKRALAKHLGVSLITVEGAFSQLVAEGYVRAVERKGYYVCDLTPAAAPAAATAPAPVQAPERVAVDKPLTCAFDLRGGSLSGAFPYDAWARSLREALSQESEATLVGPQEPLGTLRLRRVLANYLGEFRGMSVSPDQIVIGAGAQYLYNMIIQLLGAGVQVAIENPGYPRLEHIYRVNRVPVAHIPMDDQGIRVDLLAASGANLVHLTPSHQFPTGLVISAPRRYELLSWASQDSARYIIEDDYDCEFRLAGKPIAPLQRLDAQGQVIYTNTFTKSLGSAFRIGYMVLPPALADRYERELGFYSCTVSAVDQLALARFIESGAYERHVNRMRTQYRALRDQLINALRASRLADRLSFAAQDSGIHFLRGVRSRCSGGELQRRAGEHGVAISCLQSFYQGKQAEEGAVRWLVAGYSSLEPSQIASCVGALEAAWREA